MLTHNANLKLIYFFLCFIFFQSSLNQAKAEEENKNISLSLEANKLTYFAQEKKIQAFVDVIIQQKTSQGMRFLYCSEFLYDQKNHTIFAKSNHQNLVRLLEPSGETMLAKEIIINDDFKRGEIHDFILKRDPHTILKSKKVERHNPEQMTLYEADYTACETCQKEDPLWQVKADEVEHNAKTQMISYKHARLEMKGIPVLYLPYLTHPDPKVKRKSGLLFPELGHSTDLGYIVGTPVYYVIDDQQDVTLTPVLMTNQTSLFKGEYRHALQDGQWTTQASFTQSKNLQPKDLSKQDERNLPSMNRWHFFTKTKKKINDTQKIDIQLYRASDMTYLPRYILTRQSPLLSQNPNLRSHLIFQRLSQKSYTDVQFHGFQTDTPDTTPWVLPKITHLYQNKLPNRIQGTFGFESQILGLFRQREIITRSGTKVFRFSQKGYVKKPWHLPFGQTLLLNADSRLDLYMTEKYAETKDDATKNTFGDLKKHMRFFPTLSLDWQWPFLKKLSNQTRWVMTPRAMITSSPITVNNRHIPNEDCRSFEIDDTTLFLNNRFDGLDRVDVGTRFIVGLNNHWKFSQHQSIQLFVGQSYRLDTQHVTLPETGEDSKSSDIITKLLIKPFSFIQTRHRFAFNPHQRHIRFSENGFSIGEPIFKINIGHVYLHKNQFSLDNDLSQANMQITSKVNEQWHVAIGQVRNLEKQTTSASLATFVSVIYDDECFTSEIGFYHSTLKDRDIKPDVSFLVRFNFKTLSSVTLSAAPSHLPSLLTNGLGN